MAFDIDYMARVSTSANSDALKVWNYNATSTGSNETVATVAASGYFNNFQQSLTSGNESGPLSVGDIVIIQGNDDNAFYKVTSLTTNVTLASFAAIGDDSVTNAKLAEDTIQYVEVTVSTAEMKDLVANQKELVAAPGADKFIQFLGAVLILDYNSAAYTETADNMAIRYTDGSGVIVSDTIEATGFVDQTADTITNAVPVKDAIVAATGAVNQALVLDNTGDGDYATGDSPVRVQVVYRVVTAGL